MILDSCPLFSWKLATWFTCILKQALWWGISICERQHERDTNNPGITIHPLSWCPKMFRKPGKWTAMGVLGYGIHEFQGEEVPAQMAGCCSSLVTPHVGGSGYEQQNAVRQLWAPQSAGNPGVEAIPVSPSEVRHGSDSRAFEEEDPKNTAATCLSAP